MSEENDWLKDVVDVTGRQIQPGDRVVVARGGWHFRATAQVGIVVKIQKSYCSGRKSYVTVSFKNSRYSHRVDLSNSVPVWDYRRKIVVLSSL